ncbi:MAG: hypothetical protein ABSC92_17155, partial [Rhizomicrobium sp.]
TVSEVVLQFAAAIIQYFTCSTLSVRARGDETVDVPAIFEKQRPVIFGAFVALMLIGMIQNYWDRNNAAGLSSTAWIGEDVGILPMLVAIVIAGWMRPRWLQWTAGFAMIALQTYFLVVYAMPA